jgi:hypothetical protein
MLTLAKLKIYRQYDGDVNLYERLNWPLSKKEIENEDWVLISELLRDIYRINNRYTEESFKKDVEEKIKTNCENLETIKSLKELVGFYRKR